MAKYLQNCQHIVICIVFNVTEMTFIDFNPNEF
jgi:hypothetical protein